MLPQLQKATVKGKGYLQVHVSFGNCSILTVKIFLNFLYNYISGLFCLLSYWESINSHSETYNG